MKAFAACRSARAAVQALFLILWAAGSGCAQAASLPPSNPGGIAGTAPSDPECGPAVLPFRTAAARPANLELSGASNVSLQHVRALIVPHPERFKFLVFDAMTFMGILRDGCPFDIRWIVRSGPDAHGHIRLLGSMASLVGEHRYLQRPRPPEPAWTPSFEGYRHFMSSPLLIGATAHLGLWHRNDGAPGSLVAIYEAEGTPVFRMGVTDRTYEGVYRAFAVHQFMFTLVDEPEGGNPLYIVTFEWVPPSDCCRTTRRRR